MQRSTEYDCSVYCTCARTKVSILLYDTVHYNEFSLNREDFRLVPLPPRALNVSFLAPLFLWRKNEVSLLTKFMIEHNHNY